MAGAREQWTLAVLEDARPLGRVLAEATGFRVVLPEAEQTKICVRRLRQL